MFHILFYLLDVIFDTCNHLVEGFGNDADFIVCSDFESFDFKITFSHFIRRFCELSDRIDDRARKTDNENRTSEQCCGHHDNRNRFENSECRKQFGVVRRVTLKSFVIKTVDVGIYIIVKSAGFVKLRRVSFNVSATLCLDGITRGLNIFIRHISDVLFHQVICIAGNRIV